MNSKTEHRSPFYEEFQMGLENIRKAPKSSFLNNLYFTNIISLLEKYLYDLFIHEISNKHSLVQKLANTKKFKEQRLAVAFALNEDVKSWIIKSMKSLVFHRLNNVKLFFKNILDIDFENKRPVINAIKKRHHIVHRNGFDLDGNQISTSERELNELVDEIDSFIMDIDKKYLKQTS